MVRTCLHAVFMNIDYCISDSLSCHSEVLGSGQRGRDSGQAGRDSSNDIVEAAAGEDTIGSL